MSSAPRTRILVVTKNFPPLWGGMEKLNWHLIQQLAKEADVRVIAPQGAASFGIDSVVIDEVPLKPLLRFLISAQIKAIKIARSWRPDIIIAGSGLTCPMVCNAARVCGAESVAYVHGLDVAVPHWGYRLFWLPYLRRIDRVIANSTSTQELATKIGVGRKAAIVYPGVELPVLKNEAERDELRRELGVGARFILLSVGRLTERKGLLEFVRDVLPKIVEEYPETLLLVAGDAPVHSLFAKGQSQESILAAATQENVSGNIRFLGLIRDSGKLSDIYQSADVHVFPVRYIPNDPEGFGMVAIEAAAHGLPTVAYATGGVIEAVKNGVSGTLVPFPDSARFAQEILELKRNPLDASGRQKIRDFAERFGWKDFGKQIRMILQTANPNR
jgi:phosphatidyl-myo-inositol dimannoside synthase